MTDVIRSMYADALSVLNPQTLESADQLVDESKCISSCDDTLWILGVNIDLGDCMVSFLKVATFHGKRTGEAYRFLRVNLRQTAEDVAYDVSGRDFESHLRPKPSPG